MIQNQRDGLPTGEDTSAANDVADPHPSTEENYDQIPNPGRPAPPPGHDIGPNNAVHNGTAPRPPANAETVPLNRAKTETTKPRAQ